MKMTLDKMSPDLDKPVVAVVGAYPESLINFRGALIRRLSERGNRVIAMSAPASTAQVDRVRRLGADHLSYHVQRNGLNPLTDCRSLLELRNAYRLHRPQVVLAYTIKPIIWGGLALTLFQKVRFVALVTGLGFAFQGQSLKRRLLTSIVARLYRVSLRRAAAVVFQNIDNRNEFVRHKIVPVEKTFVVNGSGVDLDHFKQQPLPSGPITFLLIARLLGEKGIREYVSAAKIVKQAFPATRFVIVGPFDPSPDGLAPKELEDWQRAGCIEYHGEMADVRDSLAQCHVYVLPSYHEGMPRTVLEAMSVGRPIITTDVPGCRETVIENKNGFLVPAKDVKSLVEKMMWFIENPQQIDAMGEKSREFAETWFDVNIVNQRLLEILFPGIAEPLQETSVETPHHQEIDSVTFH